MRAEDRKAAGRKSAGEMRRIVGRATLRSGDAARGPGPAAHAGPVDRAGP